MKKKRLFYLLLACAVLLSACGGDQGTQAGTGADTESDAQAETLSTLSQIDMTAWNYNEENDVYWQAGIVYCATPADAAYENLGIYVPGAYLAGTENSDGT